MTQRQAGAGGRGGGRPLRVPAPAALLPTPGRGPSRVGLSRISLGAGPSLGLSPGHRAPGGGGGGFRDLEGQENGGCTPGGTQLLSMRLPTCLQLCPYIPSCLRPAPPLFVSWYLSVSLSLRQRFTGTPKLGVRSQSPRRDIAGTRAPPPRIVDPGCEEQLCTERGLTSSPFSPFCLSLDLLSTPCNGGTSPGKTRVQFHLHPLLPWDLRQVLLRLSLFFWQLGLMSTPASQCCGGHNKRGELGSPCPHLWGLANTGVGWGVEHLSLIHI